MRPTLNSRFRCELRLQGPQNLCDFPIIYLSFYFAFFKTMLGKIILTSDLCPESGTWRTGGCSARGIELNSFPNPNCCDLAKSQNLIEFLPSFTPFVSVVHFLVPSCKEKMNWAELSESKENLELNWNISPEAVTNQSKTLYL